jgi:hypothetical protein
LISRYCAIIGVTVSSVTAFSLVWGESIG